MLEMYLQPTYKYEIASIRLYFMTIEKSKEIAPKKLPFFKCGKGLRDLVDR